MSFFFKGWYSGLLENHIVLPADYQALNTTLNSNITGNVKWFPVSDYIAKRSLP